ncbi:MAG: Ppx/GppA phosphatase family protein [Corynebacterium sp.]|nr:Ppx/GppA phosphatase family protein [Corynebacterium sp.]
MVYRAAIDCGTNAIRLLVVDDSGAVVRRDNTIIRLGQDVDKTGRLAPEAFARFQKALDVYAQTMKSYSVGPVRMVATSAMRDASNVSDFFDYTTKVLGKPAEIISGEEEAQLSYKGATESLKLSGRSCVIDLGGGSTEFVTDAGAYSTRMGCVRLTERFGLETEESVEAARSYVREQLAIMQQHVDISAVDHIVGVAGTFITVAVVALDLDSYDEATIDGQVISFEQMRSITQKLIHQSPQERAADPRIIAGRSDVIAGGCIVIEEVMAMFEQFGHSQLHISVSDLLDGIISEL